MSQTVASAAAPAPSTVDASSATTNSGPRTRSIIVDLGGSTLKIGWAGQTTPQRMLPNCAVKNKRDTKWLVADQMLPEVIAAHAAVAGTATNGSPQEPVKQAATTVVHKITDYSGLLVRRPHDRGFVVNWDLENQVWSRAFHRSILDPTNIVPTSTTSQALLEESALLLTLPVCTPSALAKDIDENVLEKWGFAKYRRMNTSTLAHRAMMEEMYPATTASATSAPSVASSSPHLGPSSNPTSAAISQRQQLHRLCALVVDSGFSFTHVMPVYQGKTIKSAVKRINVGGKLMTNYLKELTSYRAWNMMDETWIINDAKEKLCYVSTDFDKELQAMKKSRKLQDKLRREYVLPNGSTVVQGYVRDSDSIVNPDDQTLTLTNERFSVPEVLFAPLDIGLNQSGLVESIVASVQSTPTWMHPLLYENIILVGGNTKLPNYQQRIEKELRPHVPSEYKIVCRMGKDPITTSWQGGSLLASDSLQSQSNSLQYITKAEYAEYGSEALTRKWDGDQDEEDEEMAE